MSLPPLLPRSSAPLLLALYLCLLLPTNAHAQSLEKPSLPIIIGYVQTLETRLELREKQAREQVIFWQNIVNDLTKENESDKKQSIELSETLQTAQAELYKSQIAYAETVTLLELSERAFSSYKVTSERQIKTLERRAKLYKNLTTITALSLTAAAGYIIGHRLELW